MNNRNFSGQIVGDAHLGVPLPDSADNSGTPGRAGNSGTPGAACNSGTPGAASPTALWRIPRKST